MIIVSREVLSKVWEIPFYGPIVDSLGDRIDGFRCILEQEDI